MLTRDRALTLLEECNGDDIWSVDHCRTRRVPEAWIEELAETFESGFKTDAQTIYYEGHVTNQYRGVHDLELAKKLGAFLDVDVLGIESISFGRQDVVRRIKEAVEEG